MNASTILSAALRGLHGVTVPVTSHAERARRPYLPTLEPEHTRREAEARIGAALDSSGIRDVEYARIDVGGPWSDGCDLAVALASLGVVPRGVTVGAVGELSLAGEIRDVRGTLPRVECLIESCDVVLVPRGALIPLALLTATVRTGTIVPVSSLTEAIAALRAYDRPAHCDLSEVIGNPRAVRALEIAAAGGLSLLLTGKPGSGKTMLARRLPGILPALTPNEALDVARIYSAAGIPISGPVPRPFRAPHHTVSEAGLCGDVAKGRPGEASLAHHGVLFLDELPEFRAETLEQLRATLRDRGTHGAAGFLDADPAVVVAAADTPDAVRRMKTAPRFDLHVEVEIPPMATGAARNPTSAEVRRRVVSARRGLARIYTPQGWESLPKVERVAHTIGALDRGTEEAAFKEAHSFVFAV